MIATILFFTIIFLFNKKSVTGFLALMIIASIFSGYLLGVRIDSGYVFETILSDIILFLIIIGFKNYRISRITNNHETVKYIYLYKYIVVFSSIALIVNLILFGSSFIEFLRLGQNINIFKNQGIAIDYVFSGNLSFLTVISLIFSPFSYIILGYHFYFLYNKEKKNAIISVILSSGIFLPNLIYLSRAGTVTFILMYFTFWQYTKHSFSTQKRKQAYKSIAIISISIFLILIAISQNRFSSDIIIRNSSMIKNPVLYSIMDYFAQWFQNGLVLLSRYNPSLNMHGASFAYVVNKFKEIMGIQIFDIKVLREIAFGDLATSFNGLPALLVYDLGYIGALIFGVFYFLVVKFFSPQNNVITLRKLLFFSILIPMPLMFFQGNQFLSSNFSLSVIYMFLLAFIVKYLIK